MAIMRFRWALLPWCIAAALMAFLLATAIESVSAAPTLRTVALTGQQAPGTSEGTTYGVNFAMPVLNDAGQTSFQAHMIGGDVSGQNFQGVWSEGSGALTLVARQGNQVPGAPTNVNYGNFGRIVLNDVGHVAFWASFFGAGVRSGVDDSGILVQRPGGVTLVAREGSQAVDLPAGVIYDSDFAISSLLNNAGQTAFSAVIRGNGMFGLSNSGIWSEGSGSLALLVRNGDSPPGTSSEVSFTTPLPNRPFETPLLNDAGQTAFRARLTGSGVDGTNNFGIWSGTPGTLRQVARAGSHAPGMPSGVTFTGTVFGSPRFGAPVLNNAGQTAFFAGLTGGGVDGTNDEGIWSEGTGSLALVAREGSQAPGTAAGVTFHQFYGSDSPSMVLNNAGKTAFYAFLSGNSVTGLNSRGIWSEGFGSVVLVARAGEAAPDTPAGVTFADFDFRSLVLNDAGQAAFVATVTGSGVNSTNDRGIWAQDRTGELRLVAREGNVLEVSPGEFRTISSTNFSGIGDFIGGTGNGDGRPSGFNNRGQLAFQAKFTDDSRGIFVSNHVAVPEPATLICFALAITSAFALSRRFRV